MLTSPYNLRGRGCEFCAELLEMADQRRVATLNAVTALATTRARQRRVRSGDAFGHRTWVLGMNPGTTRVWV